MRRDRPGPALGAKILETNHDKPHALNNIFWAVVHPKLKTAPDPRIAQLALKAIRRADELTHGRTSPSRQPGRRALSHRRHQGGHRDGGKGDQQLDAEKVDRSNGTRKSYEETLEMFRKAAAEKGARP